MCQTGPLVHHDRDNGKKSIVTPSSASSAVWYDCYVWWRSILLLSALTACACEPTQSRSSSFEPSPESDVDASDSSACPVPGTECGGFAIFLSCPDAGAVADASHCPSPTPFGDLELDGGFPVGCLLGTDVGTVTLDGACAVPSWTCEGLPAQWVESVSNL